MRQTLHEWGILNVGIPETIGPIDVHFGAQDVSNLLS